MWRDLDGQDQRDGANFKKKVNFRARFKRDGVETIFEQLFHGFSKLYDAMGCDPISEQEMRVELRPPRVFVYGNKCEKS